MLFEEEKIPFRVKDLKTKKNKFTVLIKKKKNKNEEIF